MIICCRHPAQSTSSTLPAPALPLCHREILVLAVNERPDFIALDAADTHVLIRYLAAKRSEVFQELQNTVFRHCSHAAGRVSNTSG